MSDDDFGKVDPARRRLLLQLATAAWVAPLVVSFDLDGLGVMPAEEGPDTVCPNNLSPRERERQAPAPPPSETDRPRARKG